MTIDWRCGKGRSGHSSQTLHRKYRGRAHKITAYESLGRRDLMLRANQNARNHVMMRCSRDVTSVSVVDVGPIEIMGASQTSYDVLFHLHLSTYRLSAATSRFKAPMSRSRRIPPVQPYLNPATSKCRKPSTPLVGHIRSHQAFGAHFNVSPQSLEAAFLELEIVHTRG